MSEKAAPKPPPLVHTEDRRVDPISSISIPDSVDLSPMSHLKPTPAGHWAQDVLTAAGGAHPTKPMQLSSTIDARQPLVIRDGSNTSHDPKPPHRPSKTYLDLDRAFEILNMRLFDGKLPPVLVTYQRHRGARGYFAAKRLSNIADQAELVHEIAISPACDGDHLRKLSTLAHEMVHLHQFKFGTPGRGRYHNAEFARMMGAIGLIASDTGAPGGKTTGERMSHYIVPNGRFERVSIEFLTNEGLLLYADRSAARIARGGSDGAGGDRRDPDTDDQDVERQRARKAASKTRYDCPCRTCTTKAWAKPEAKLMCGVCNLPLTAQEIDR